MREINIKGETLRILKISNEFANTLKINYLENNP